MYRENVSQQPAYDFGDKFVGVVGASNVYGQSHRGRQSTSGSFNDMNRMEQLKNGAAMGFDQNWNLPRISTVRANARGNSSGLAPPNIRQTTTGGNSLRTVQEPARGQKLLNSHNNKRSMNSQRGSQALGSIEGSR